MSASGFFPGHIVIHISKKLVLASCNDMQLPLPVGHRHMTAQSHLLSKLDDHKHCKCGFDEHGEDIQAGRKLGEPLLVHSAEMSER